MKEKRKHNIIPCSKNENTKFASFFFLSLEVIDEIH